jgi:DNA-binding transcriptional MerR regulator
MSSATRPSSEDDFVTTRELCERLEVAGHRIEHLLRSRQVDRPRLIGGRRVFSVEQVERIRALLAR